MPTEWLPWSQAIEPVCVNDPGEPWGLGVWDEGEHAADCPVVADARNRVVDWSPTLANCTCGGADNLMFWLIDGQAAGHLSDEQAQVMKSNVVVQ